MNIDVQDKVGVKGRYRIITTRAGTKEVLRVSPWIENKIMSNVTNGGNGVNLIVQRHIGLVTYDLEITSASIGTGTTAAAATQSGLVTPVAVGIPRATQTTSTTATAATALIQFFISDADLPNGTYTEFGIFCGTQLFARSIITPSYSKATAEDSTFEYDITYTV